MAALHLTLKDNRVNQDQSWDIAHEEIHSFNSCYDLHSREVEAYSHMKDKCVPRLFANIRLDISTISNAFFPVLGILLEFIDGYNLGECIREKTIHNPDSISDRGSLTQGRIPQYSDSTERLQ